MGERKVLNKYFPPDFDPNLVPKRKFDPFKQIETRMMLPFNIQCDTCGEFMYVCMYVCVCVCVSVRVDNWMYGFMDECPPSLRHL